jgi:hypothetical protein
MFIPGRIPGPGDKKQRIPDPGLNYRTSCKKLNIGMAVLVGIVTSRDIDFIVEKKDEGASIALRYRILKGLSHETFKYILVIRGRGLNSEKPINVSTGIKRLFQP